MNPLELQEEREGALPDYQPMPWAPQGGDLVGREGQRVERL